MRRLLPLLLLGLSACELVQPLLTQVAGAAAGAAQGAAASALGIEQTGNTATPVQPGPAPASTSTNTTTPTTGAAAGANTTATAGGYKTVSFDSAKKLEYVDIYVDLGDPAGQRALVPYLMKPEDWMLCKCQMLSPTTKHYTFMRVSTADGRSLPQVDIFKQSR